MELDDKYFDKNYKVDYKIKVEDNLIEGEKILWKGKPKKSSYAWSKSIAVMPIAILWGVIDFSLIIAVIKNGQMTAQTWLILISFFGVHLLPCWIFIGTFIKQYKYLKGCQYYITNKRIIASSGIKGQVNFEIKLSELKNVQLKRNFIDKLFRVGDIYLVGEKSSSVLFDIHDSTLIYERLYPIILEKKKKDAVNAIYKYNQICEYCGSYYLKKIKRCPVCGAKNPEYVENVTNNDNNA